LVTSYSYPTVIGEWSIWVALGKARNMTRRFAIPKAMSSQRAALSTRIQVTRDTNQQQ
jgi:hypothetical protein